MSKYKIAILLATKNGAKYIEEQLHSLFIQKNVDVDLYINDDESNDQTFEIIKNIAIKYPENFKFINQKNCGSPSLNFQFISKNISTRYDYYAFCDQDDIWEKDKLIAGIGKLNEGYDLYGSRTTYVNEDLFFIGKSPLFNKHPDFSNAIVQSLAGANTMIFKYHIFNLFKESADTKIVSHDWWIYIITMYFGYKFYFDKDSYILYRQHDGNYVGKNTGIRAKFGRLKLIFNGTYENWNDINFHAINKLKNSGNKKNILKLNMILEYKKNKNLLYALKIFFKKIIYRQTFIGQMTLLISFLFKKF